MSQNVNATLDLIESLVAEASDPSAKTETPRTELKGDAFDWAPDQTHRRVPALAASDA